VIARRSHAPAGWRRAACAAPGVDPELFFPAPGQHGKAARAKRVCARCPVRTACLADALATGDEFGIRGGLALRSAVPGGCGSGCNDRRRGATPATRPPAWTGTRPVGWSSWRPGC
jgi:hypothetical protein